MTTCIPESLNHYDPTPGERRVFDILKSLPDGVRVWYEVEFGERDRRPDFVLLDPCRGIVIIEVKDYGRPGATRSTA